MDQKTSSSHILVDYWHLIVRRKWLVLAIFLVCVVGAAILSVVLPESYRSYTLIMVESQKLPENYVQAILGASLDERLNSLQHQVLRRAALTQVIQEFDLYPDLTRSNGLEAVVERLRKDSLITTSGPLVQRGVIDAFSISFAHENPTIAMNVTARLASLFMEENLRAREQRVEGASEFIEQELALAKERLEGQERTVSQFKAKHMGELSEQVPANLSALDRLQIQHNATSEAIHRTTDRLTLIEKTIKEYEMTGVMAGGTAGGTVQGGGGEVVDPLILRLRELEKNLATLSAEYKDNYPDIGYLRQEIRDLKAQLKDKKNRVGVIAEHEKSSGKDVKSTDPYLRDLLRHRDEVTLELASLRDRLAGTKSEIRKYEWRVEQAPVRDHELQILIRDYNNVKENYRALLDKKLNAQLSEHHEKRQKGSQFRIIDPANLPTKPEKPDRIKIMLIGLVMGCGLGVASAATLESLRPVFRRSVDIENLFRFRVLASIPNFRIMQGKTEKLLPWSAVTSTSSGAVNGPLSSSLIAGETQKGSYGGSSGGRSTTTALTERRSNRSGFRREFDLIGKWNPASVVAEQFRVAATRLVLQQSKNIGNVTVVTSSLKGEGKSIVAANLAYALARDIGKRVLLIDGDLKCPMIHQCMAIPQSPGLRDVLQGTQSVDSCLRQEGELPLWILPSGEGTKRGPDLSQIQKIEGILAEIKGQYDHIVIDAPPILPLADMHVLAGMADVLILVIRAGLTPRSVVEDAIRTVGANDDTCIILNGLETKGIPSYMQEGFEYVQKNEKSGVYQRQS